MSKTYQTNQNLVKGQTVRCCLNIDGHRMALCLPAASFWSAFIQIYPLLKGVA